MDNKRFSKTAESVLLNRLKWAHQGKNDDFVIFPRRKVGTDKRKDDGAPVVLTLELLALYFDRPLLAAATKLGICATALKKVCRKMGIQKWPYKELKPSLKPRDEDNQGREISSSPVDQPKLISKRSGRSILLRENHDAAGMSSSGRKPGTHTRSNAPSGASPASTPPPCPSSPLGFRPYIPRKRPVIRGADTNTSNRVNSITVESGKTSAVIKGTNVPDFSAKMNPDDFTIFPRCKGRAGGSFANKTPVVVTYDILKTCFDMPLHAASEKLGICITAIKKVCRKMGIKKWPYRELKVRKKVTHIREPIDLIPGFRENAEADEAENVEGVEESEENSSEEEEEEEMQEDNDEEESKWSALCDVAFKIASQRYLPIPEEGMHEVVKGISSEVSEVTPEEPTPEMTAEITS